jgi:Tn3 transposase DDE domain
MLLRRLDDELLHHPSLRIENNSLVVGPLKAEDERPSLAALEALVDARLPLIELPDLLMEVDGWTGFSRHLEHAGGAEPRTPDLLVHCHVSILAQACKLRVNPNGSASGLVVPAARLVYHLVFARRNASTSDR